MKKIGWGLMACVVLGGLYLQDKRGLVQDAKATTDPVMDFVRHPTRCAHLLGVDTGGDIPPPDFHIDLEAALDASGQPAERAIVQINTLCRQHLGRAG